VSGEFSIRVRPGLIGRLAFAQFYYWAIPIAGGILVAIEFPIVFAIRGEISGRLPPAVMMLLAVAWVALATPLWRVAHRINIYFLDRTALRLTPTTLYLGRHEQTAIALADIRAAYFATQHGLGQRKSRTATKRVFNILLLVLADGSLVPLSPPPGTFIDLEPAMNPGASNVLPFIRTVVSLVESVLRENEPLPPEALPFLHPLEANRRHDPSRRPPTSMKWKLIRLTWL
jgi:hypothetical protein